MAERAVVAIAQLTSTSDVAANAARCVALIARAAAARAQAVFFPEASDYISEGAEQGRALAQPLTGSFLTAIRDAARAHAVWVAIGVHEKTDDATDPRFFNSHVLVNTQGDIADVYHKLHLFDISMANGPTLKESDAVRPGDRMHLPVATPLGNVGLQVCYDLRFPEVSRYQRNHGAHILTFPSAFTVKTGQAHWEVLLRARAIENQCYVVAAAQTGQHNAKRASYGHGMIVDPWGTVVAECTGLDDTVAVAELDPALLTRVRAEMPVHDHARRDVYTIS